ncbi:unnamed protein product [Tuber aestivum]|uniref:Myb/SANT-like domain-containing protein n=1 Tax=Tuber aestivum TaxID=59557 RepID=A0A292PVU0_9PEZI|nr:unnamed protein product [Tuber aestivum]
MSLPTSKKSEAIEAARRARWVEGEQRTLVETLVEEVRNGKRAENGFKLVTFAVVQKKIHEKHGSLYEIQQIKNKFNAIKKDYDVFKTLKAQSGFGWDEATQNVTADGEVWDRYLKAHPLAKKFRKEPLKWQQELDELFTGTRATGNNAIIPSQIFQEGSQVGGSYSRIIGLDLDEIESEGLRDKRQTEETQIGGMESEEKDMGAGELEERGSTGNTIHQGQAKKRKRERSTKESEIANALLQLGSISGELNKGKTKRAVQELMEKFMEILNDDEMVEAVGIMEDIKKAEAFLGINNMRLREKWLQKQLLS